MIPQGFEKFEAKRGGRGESFPIPYLHISKWGIYINKATTKEVGDKYKFAVLYWDKKRDTIGVWFWKEAVIGAYKIVRGKYPNAWHITAGQFLKEYDVLSKVKRSGRDYFPFKRDTTNKEFYTARLT
jgi:hypothetical protein